MKKNIFLIMAILFLLSACSNHSVDTSNTSRAHSESYVQGLHDAAKNHENITCNNGYQQGLKDGS